MAFTLVGYSSAIDSAVLTELAGVTDPHVRVLGNQIITPGWANYLAGAYAIGVNLTRAQVHSPTLRRIVTPDIIPFDRVATPANPPTFHSMVQTPVALTPDEIVTAQASEDGTGATRCSIFLWLSDRPMTPTAGQFFTIRGTASATLAAYTWTNAALTLDSTLPAGEYAIVGARAQSAGLIAFRFVLPGMYHRPGGVGATAANTHTPEGQRLGGWGEWGRFVHHSPPTVDFLSSSADTSETVWMDLLKVS